MAIKFNELQNITFNGAVYNEVTKSSDNTSAVTQEASNVTYDNFLLHSSKEWLSTIENVSSELIKEAKETSDKVKADSKVIEATKKAAPDKQPYKDTEKKIQEGIKDLAANVKAMTKVTEYSGAINFITSTAVNTITGSIVNISDLGTINKSPSITNTTNVEVNNAATSINYSDTIFSKSDRRVTVSNQELLSASDQHSVVNNTTSITSTNNKTAAVEAHEVVTDKQKQYNTTMTSLSAESTLIGSKGTTSVIASNNITIGAGQSSKTSNSQAEVEDDISNPISDLNSGGTGSITILSTGNITSQATGNAITSADTVGTNANKIGLLSIDFSSQSTTTSINSKAQSSVTSDGITYTGNKNTGILISPTSILAGTGLAPLIPIIGEVLPPIIVDIPELPEFPFGDLADFLAKCLPFTSAINIPNLPNQGQQDEEIDIALEEPLVPQRKSDSNEDVLISLEEPLVVQNKGGPQEEPVDISLEEPLVAGNKAKNTKESAAPKGTKAEQKDRKADQIPNIKTDNKQEEKPFTPKAAVSNAARLGILNKCYIDIPEGNTNPKTTTNLLAELPAITPKLGFSESLKSISGLQQSEVVNSFNKDLRANINNNYQDFLKAAAIVDTLGPQTIPLPEFSKTVNDFITDNKTTVQIRQLLNTLRPIGQGGQQPPNIQDDISNPISDFNTRGLFAKTPPTPGQGILDTLTTLQANQQSTSIFSSTTDNWFNPEDITDFTTSDIEFGEQLLDNQALSSFSEVLNNQYVDIIKGFIPDSKIQSALSLTQDIAAGKITTPEQYASRLSSLVGGEVGGYINYAQQAFDIYKQVESGNYSSLLGIPGISNVLGSQGTAIASKVLGLIGKNNITDKDIYDIAGSIFTALTGIGIPLLDELAKLLGCIGSIKEQQPFLQDISDPDLQDIIDFLPRIIQTVPNTSTQSRAAVLNITPNNCNQVSELSAEEASINVTEIGQGYIKFKLANKDLIRFNSNPIPTIGTPVNLYSEFYTDRLNNNVLLPYKIGSQFTSNVLEYTITSKQNEEYTALQNNPNIRLTLEDNIIGALFEYTSNDIGNRLQPFILDSYVLL